MNINMEDVRNRDKRFCQFPKYDYDDTVQSKRLHVHHIDGDKNNCGMYNLISLCGKHHAVVEGNPHSWEDYFYTITISYESYQ